MYPLKLKPVYKETIWGGTRIKEIYGKKASFEKIAESWETAALPAGKSVAENGKYAGKNLCELTEECGGNLLGTLCGNEFPLCFKIIDAEDDLSVQVHPGDEYALKKHGCMGKTEMWYVLEADENAQIIFGFKEDTNKEEFLKAIGKKDVANMLCRINVKKGDSFYIPAGTIHAIGKGVLIAEIQQSSDITYRVYDWDRIDKNGKGRQLHIEDAANVADYRKFSCETNKTVEIKGSGYVRKILASGKYFTSEEIKIDTRFEDDTETKSFHILFCAEGECTIVYENIEYTMKKGDTWLIPAECGKYEITGMCTLLKNYIS